MIEPTTEQRLNSLDSRMNGLTHEVRELRRQRPVRWAVVVYALVTLAGLWAAKVGLDNGKVWEILIAVWFSASFMIKTLAAWQDALADRARQRP